MHLLLESKFDYNLNFSEINFRKSPELYVYDHTERGVLLIEPYKSEILPFWRFRTPEIARESSAKIYEMFLEYKKQKDFVGMDMALVPTIKLKSINPKMCLFIAIILLLQIS